MPDETFNLEVLRRHCEALWLAEMGAWLHNVGKLAQVFQEDSGSTNDFHPEAIVGRFRTEIDRVPEFPSRFKRWGGSQREFAKWKDVWNIPIELPEPFRDRQDYRLGDFIDLQNSFWYGDGGLRQLGLTSSALTELLYVCHEAASGSDKPSQRGVDQTHPNGDVYFSSPFGYEEARSVKDLDAARDSLLLEAVRSRNRTRFLKDAAPVMKAGLAETRRPANDIDVWDFSSSVAAFFKAALAKCILERRLERKWPGRERMARDFAWQLLRIGINGPEFYGRVARLPDLLARRKLMEKLLDGARDVLENGLCLANEIYRDEQGAVFLAPALNDDAKGELLAGAIRGDLEKAWEQTGIEDVVPRIEAGGVVDSGVFSPRPSSEIRDLLVGKALALGRAIQAPAKPLKSNPVAVAEWWGGKSGDVCPVCGLRPQSSSGRKTCETCDERRGHRSRDWLQGGLEDTIWLEEVADRTGRIALVSGCLQLQKWLEADREAWGPGFAADPNQDEEGLPASFARIRRVWQTASMFWREVEKKARETAPKGGPRIRLSGQFRGQAQRGLRVSRTYLLAKEGIRYSFVYTDQGTMLGAENVERAALLAGAPEHEIVSAQTAVDWLAANRFPVGAEFEVEEQTGYGSANQNLGRFRVDSSEEEQARFDPVIAIAAEPRSFQLLVPARHAPAVVNLMEERYAAEFSKVRHRLPIHLGVVYAPAATPLYAILDAARRMMARPPRREPWQVQEGRTAGQSVELRFVNGAIWNVPGSLADDPAKADRWHPQFETAQGWKLAGELEAGDSVWVGPSTFDFEFLDVAGRRFEIIYTAEGQRGARSPNRHRPYPLHRLRVFGQVWMILDRGLRGAQIHAARGLLVEKAYAWGDAGETYQVFAETVLKGLHWRKRPNQEQWKVLKTALREGYFLDSIELHAGILKLGGEQTDERRETGVAK